MKQVHDYLQSQFTTKEEFLTYMRAQVASASDNDDAFINLTHTDHFINTISSLYDTPNTASSFASMESSNSANDCDPRAPDGIPDSVGFGSALARKAAQAIKPSVNDFVLRYNHLTGNWGTPPSVGRYYSLMNFSKIAAKIVMPLTVGVGAYNIGVDVGSEQYAVAGKDATKLATGIIGGIAVAALMPVAASTLSVLAIGGVVGYLTSESYGKIWDALQARVQSGNPNYSDIENDLLRGINNSLSDGSPIALNNLPPEDMCERHLPTTLDSIKALFGFAAKQPSPLVLDVDGSGAVELTSLTGVNAHSVYFDVNNDGYSEATAWVTGGDGLLCIDKNGNGTIDNGGELFGDQTGKTNGFISLSAYDSNKDGKITAEDQRFSDLRVWIDANEDYFYGYAKNKSKSRVNVSRETFSSIIPPSYLTKTTYATRNVRAV